MSTLKKHSMSCLWVGGFEGQLLILKVLILKIENL